MTQHATLSDQVRELEIFLHWLLPRYPEFSIGRTEAHLHADGSEEVRFVLRRARQPMGCFRSPREALTAIGNDSLATAFQSHLLQLPPERRQA